MRHWWQREGRSEQIDTAHAEAKEAFAKSLEDRLRAEDTADQVEPLMEQLKERRQVNHYTQLFEQVLRGKR